MGKIVKLDGSTLEGGGQLVRIAIGVSALTATPVSISNIRGNRSGGGGLRAQHLAAVQWLAAVSSADTEGAALRSRDLKFIPSRRLECAATATVPVSVPAEFKDSDKPCLRARDVVVGGVGSVTSVFQAILPFILFSRPQRASTARLPAGQTYDCVTVSMSGGTNVLYSPSIDYVMHVLVPVLARIGISVDVTLGERGWCHGRADPGSAMFTVTPLTPGQTLPAFELVERGHLTSLNAYLIVPSPVQKDGEAELHEQLSQHSVFQDLPLRVQTEDSGHPARCYLLLVATSSTGCRLGADWLVGVKMKDRALVARKLVGKVIERLDEEVGHGGCVDTFMRDQLVVFQALANGKSEVYGGRTADGEPVAASLHTKTAH